MPDYGTARVLTVAEAGTGFAFLALLIGYLPVVYHMFARRETNVSLLDQRAGSPPGAEFVRRNIDNGHSSGLMSALAGLELWIGDLLENHLSYPTLSYFRTQHENQSWVGARAYGAASDLTNALAINPIESGADRVGETAVHVYRMPQRAAVSSRNHLSRYAEIVRDGPRRLKRSQIRRLAAIRSTYDPFPRGLSEYMLMVQYGRTCSARI